MNLFLKSLWLIVGLFLFSSHVFGQVKQNDEVEISTYIGDVRSIKINQSQFNVNFSIDNVAQLMNGQSLKQLNHIQVTSTSEYQIEVVASSELQGKNTTIPVNTVSIIPSLGKSNSYGKTIYLSPVSLSTNEQSIIQSFSGDVLRTFDVSYRISSWAKYVNDNPSDTYRTTITYSIVAN